ncbi:MAG: hypothetical protein PHQ87_10380, partial [Hydrogenophaga sp.]|uniref:hypothetical protein n=1 Tax=Hydrogenophaga sp. TaxID=1904254 RepID=UPI00262154BF
NWVRCSSVNMNTIVPQHTPMWTGPPQGWFGSVRMMLYRMEYLPPAFDGVKKKWSSRPERGRFLLYNTVQR